MSSPRFELRLGEPGYPAQLAATPQPPPVLYGLGDPGVLSSGLAVVGSRRATPYGLDVAFRFAAYAAASGYVVISGGARGCDQAAHSGALSVEGRTVCVLACGADLVYPRTAAALLKEIARTGAVVSEHPWGTAATKWAFRTRNRIIAGLSGALLVVEAAVPSGTFSTADYAADAGRDVLAVPGSIVAPECAGPNRLIRQGATPITDMTELAEALASACGPAVRPFSTSRQGSSYDEDPVLRAVRADPMRPDDLARALDMDVIAVVRRLGALEAAGRVARYRDGRYGPHYVG